MSDHAAPQKLCRNRACAAYDVAVRTTLESCLVCGAHLTEGGYDDLLHALFHGDAP